MRRRRIDRMQEDQQATKANIWPSCCLMRRAVAKSSLSPFVVVVMLLALTVITCYPEKSSATPATSGLRFDPETNSYSGLTFTFDPRLDKRVEWLHFDHWLSIMQHSSSLLYDTLNGRAHLNEVRVLIPYKWRQFEWPVLQKPGSPIIMNRRLRYVDSDVIVGFEDPVHKETPFAVQHDECAKQGLNIHMPISFLEQNQPLDPKLKARLLVREFASHRYGIFKESGFRNDYMYPPFSSLPGFNSTALNRQHQHRIGNSSSKTTTATTMMTAALIVDNAAANLANQSAHEQLVNSIRGYDEQWNECSFDTTPSTGLPTASSINCAPYLTRQQQVGDQQFASASFNLMSADPFSYGELSSVRATSAKLANQPMPLEWRQLADSVRWHFCGPNFPHHHQQQQLSEPTANKVDDQVSSLQQQLANKQQSRQSNWFAHNKLAGNKQNVMCNEHSAMDVIKSSDDFRRTPFSPSTFNRLPATTFKFLQEMPPRVILCVEYAAHLYQSRRLDHGILEAAIAKFLAYDLIADTEIALVLFGQQHSTRNGFKKLDSSVDSRLTLYSPPIDPFDEPAKLYSEQELAQMDVQASNGQAKVVKGTCSFATVMLEATALQQQRSQYDDVGADIVIVTSGLFVEDEAKIEEILKTTNFKSDNLQLNLIIYPSTMLFDTKSRDGFVVLDAIESETIVRSRISKLQLIQRLTSAKIHLVKEHLDANGDVKMSTLVQFYQIFDHISKGHSWDQTHSMLMLSQQTVDARPQANGSKLSFQFELDGSIQNELIVGFIDPKQHQQSRSGKRFAIKNLQLRSPGGHLILTDSHPWSAAGGTISNSNHQSALQQDAASSSLSRETNDENVVSAAVLSHHNNPEVDQQQQPPSAASESTLFPYRTQLGLAGFHLKAAHLAQLNASHKLAGVWTLSATSDEPIQTNALAMARVNPVGDTIIANCWIQTYHQEALVADSSQTDNLSGNKQHIANQQPPLKTVKVFVQTKAGAQVGPIQEVNARMEVQDEMGNIVQNVNMLDDGLGVPDMTRGDGILSQYVQRAYRPGYYKVTVDMSGASSNSGHQATSRRPLGGQGQSGQDNTCCGSFVPPGIGHQPDTRHLNRQLYCGTFYVDTNNKLAQQRPPRVNNLTVVNVDQDNRRVTIRWFEPSVDISVHNLMASSATNKQYLSENDLALQDSELSSSNTNIEPLALVSSSSRLGERLKQVAGFSTTSGRHSSSSSSSRTNGESEESEQLADGSEHSDETLAFDTISANQAQQMRANSVRGLIVGGVKPLGPSSLADQQSALNNRYEIKLFSDRGQIKRTWSNDGVSEHEVGFKFNEWNVEGTFPNASAYGGMKEVTLRIPYGREGIYYIAMKVYNNLGIGSHISNIVQFWVKNNLTLEEAEIYGQPTTVDAEGNVYDKNGEMIQRANSSLFSRGSSALDGISILMFISVVVFIMAIVCISLTACLISSAKRSFGKRHSKSEDKKAVASSAIIGAGSGSSMVSSGCGSSQQSEVASSVSGSQCGGHDVEINKLSLGDDLQNYGNIQQHHQHQQHQAQMIQNHLISGSHHNHHLIGNNDTMTAHRPHHNMDQQQQQQQMSAGNQHMSYQQQQFSTDALYQRQQFSGSNNSMSDNSVPAKTTNQWLQHTVVNGYPYATVNTNGLMLPETANSACSPNDSAGGNLNQNGLGVPMSPVQSWPADILLSHYDKVKQARERNEAPPVMRIETLEHQGQFTDGLPAVTEDQQQQQVDQSYLVRQQRNQMPSYFNQQLQQQLSSVLKSKQQRNHNSHHHQQQQHQDQHDHQLHHQTLDKSSPALEGVTDLHEVDTGSGGAGYNQQLDQLPPPQYVYCTAGDNNGLVSQQQMITEPSIYSQVTNLQQVSSADTLNSYYANHQWQPSSNATSTIYSSQADQYQQQQQQQVGDNYVGVDKSNSAISEV